MEKKIQDTYKKMDELIVYSRFIYIMAIIGFFVIFSLLWGRPFSQAIYINNERVYFGGWITMHAPCVFLTIILLWFFVFVWQHYTTKKQLLFFSSLLSEHCDVTQCLAYTTYGIEYGKQLLSTTGKKSAATKNTLGFFENLHMVALSTANRYEEAIAYCDYEWTSKKQKITTTNYMLIKLKLAYINNDTIAYQTMYENVYPRYKYKNMLKARKAMFEGKYEDALHLFLQEQTKNILDQVTMHYHIACCYKELDLLSEAKSHYEFVREHGNTLPIKDHALKELHALYGE